MGRPRPRNFGGRFFPGLSYITEWDGPGPEILGAVFSRRLRYNSMGRPRPRNFGGRFFPVLSYITAWDGPGPEILGAGIFPAFPK
jgi:hypothetical protein